MTIRSLSEVRLRLEESAQRLSADDDTNQDRYDRYEMLAIQILDSEFEDYEQGEHNKLEDYLMTLLHLKRLELGLSD